MDGRMVRLEAISIWLKALEAAPHFKTLSYSSETGKIRIRHEIPFFKVSSAKFGLGYIYQPCHLDSLRCVKIFLPYFPAPATPPPHFSSYLPYSFLRFSLPPPFNILRASSRVIVTWETRDRTRLAGSFDLKVSWCDVWWCVTGDATTRGGGTRVRRKDWVPTSRKVRFTACKVGARIFHPRFQAMLPFCVRGGAWPPSSPSRLPTHHPTQPHPKSGEMATVSYVTNVAVAFFGVDGVRKSSRCCWWF